MSPDKTKELFDIHPSFFTSLHPFEPLSMSGFDCGDGWMDVLRKAFTEMKEVAERNGYNTKITQVKEKYGTLRIYLDADFDDFDHIIQRAEKESSETCELCGKPGELVNDGWYHTFCSECASK